MIDHMQCYFGMLRDGLYYCEQVRDAAEVEFRDQSLDPEHVDEIQHAVRLLVTLSIPTRMRYPWSTCGSLTRVRGGW